MEAGSIYSPAGTISLTNPFEIHANPIESGVQDLSFDTLYLSQELVDHYLKHKKRSFYQRVYQDIDLLEGFERIKGAMIQPHFAEQLENSLEDFLQLLNRSENSGEKEPPVSLHAKWSELILYIDQHLSKKTQPGNARQFPAHG